MGRDLIDPLLLLVLALGRVRCVHARWLLYQDRCHARCCGSHLFLLVLL
jgi:hypothetical protein